MNIDEMSKGRYYATMLLRLLEELDTPAERLQCYRQELERVADCPHCQWTINAEGCPYIMIAFCPDHIRSDEECPTTGWGLYFDGRPPSAGQIRTNIR